MSKPEIQAVSLSAVKWLASLIAGVWVQVPFSTQMLVIFMAFDFGTGWLAAVVTKTVSSRRAYVGIAKKILTLSLVAVAHLVSTFLHLGFDLGSLAATAYILHEVVSIAEKCDDAGVPLPDVVMSVLATAKGLDARDRRQIDRLNRGEDTATKD